MSNYEDLRKNLRVASQHAENLSQTQENRYFYNQLAKLLRDSAYLISIVEEGAYFTEKHFETNNPLISIISDNLRKDEK